MFQAQASISKVTTMHDHSLRIQVDTQELSPEDSAKVFEQYNKLGWFLFKESEILLDDIDVPEFVAEFKDDKSPSKRLRNVIFILHKQQDTKESFDEFYKRKIEEIINHFKSKLD